MGSVWTLLWAYEIFENAKNELEAHRKPWCTLVVHPSVVAYDYRIAWTWEEMDKRNKSKRKAPNEWSFSTFKEIF